MAGIDIRYIKGRENQMINNMYEYYNFVKGNNINIIYNGPIWSDGVEGIGNTLRKRLEIDELPLSASQAVFSVFIEQMNNMLYYSSEKEVFTNSETGKSLDIGAGIFILGSIEKKYFLQTGNIIKKEQQNLIRERIEYLNTLDKAEMRKYYKERIKSENDNPESKGAGLGLIEIARRASSKIEYSFTETDEKYSFFTMYVTIG